MRKTIDSLVNGVWLTQPPTFSGQQVRETTYFDDGSFGVVEYACHLPDAPETMKVTQLAFKNRMTPDERKAIRRAALVSEDIQDFVDLANSATYIDLSLQQTIDSVNALELAGLIGAGRAAEILSPPVNEDEKWSGL
jgi:plasmid stability protein